MAMTPEDRAITQQLRHARTDAPALRWHDDIDYRIMLECARRASEFTPVGRMRHDVRREFVNREGF